MVFMVNWYYKWRGGVGPSEYFEDVITQQLDPKFDQYCTIQNEQPNYQSHFDLIYEFTIQSLRLTITILICTPKLKLYSSCLREIIV